MLYSTDEARYRADLLATYDIFAEALESAAAASEYAGDIAADLVICSPLVLGEDFKAGIGLARSKSRGLPVVLWGNVSPIARGLLLAGADEVLSPAMSIDEVAARLSLVMSRHVPASRGIEYAGVVLEVDSNELVLGGMRVLITGLEGGFLEALMHARGRVVPKQALMDRVYSGFEQPGVKIVDVIVCKLRAKIEGFPFEIETVWGRGYRLCLRGQK